MNVFGLHTPIFKPGKYCGSIYATRAVRILLYTSKLMKERSSDITKPEKMKNPVILILFRKYLFKNNATRLN